MARVAVYMLVSDEDLKQGWNDNVAEFEESVKARLSEIYGDDGGAYVPQVLGVEVDDDEEEPEEPKVTDEGVLFEGRRICMKRQPIAHGWYCSLAPNHEGDHIAYHGHHSYEGEAARWSA